MDQYKVLTHLSRSIDPFFFSFNWQKSMYSNALTLIHKLSIIELLNPTNIRQLNKMRSAVDILVSKSILIIYSQEQEGW